ncbi:arabinan endo-1,5-alpha-L-arabinosidase [Lipingzhangella sp. LS1_29]|uniref:Arabinan endo-1,5-alpha-L-arabinosidase n=1 Tax=Lipingzhangella rawalii TaxID=2055835 RepID=A0ABU2H2Z3_9ACTN|nr:arabinan endo-1,5-alpha-L-arabinosidase [Lipingzhangella rawalii]MDS1269671.1 arabinan endo-1,5-alpha-L-arabinosidase [Lipingzhangella rawalii]
MHHTVRQRQRQRPLRALAALAALAVTTPLITAGTGADGTMERPPNNPGLPLVGYLPDHDPTFTAGLRVHDPVLVPGDRGNGADWYVFGTGNPNENDGTIQIRSSRNGILWEYQDTVWEEIPDWISTEIPGVETLWAPEVYEDDGTYYLYYAASTFGSNRSLIGLATNATLDPSDPDYAWEDHGKILESFPQDDYNAIDPGIVADSDGTHWMVFGSFWSGIHMVELDWPAGTVADDAEMVHLADRRDGTNAIEAPTIVQRGDYYYLFVSLDHCCTVNSDYKIAVGRSEAITGPYVDADGVPMLDGGATVLVADEGTITGSGGQSVTDDGGLLAYHYYDTDLGDDFDFRLALRELHWTADGWPYVD